MRNLIRNVSHSSRCAPLSTVNFAMKPRRPVATPAGTISSDGITSLVVWPTALNYSVIPSEVEAATQRTKSARPGFPFPWQAFTLASPASFDFAQGGNTPAITTSFRGTSSYRTARNRRAFRRCRRSAWEFQVHPGSPPQCRLCRCHPVWSRLGQ